MTTTKVSRGRPKLAPEDNETRERILNTAQRLFAEKGFDKVNLRELTKEAGTHLAAVNYYFGSKDKLLTALVQRAAKLIYKQRMTLLENARTTQGSTKEKVEQILRALLIPVILIAHDPDSDFMYSTLIARTMSDGPDELVNVMEKQTSHLTPFVEELQKTLPNISAEDIFWRLHFLLNIEHATHTELGRLKHLSGGICDTSNKEAILDRIIRFSLPGFLQDN